MLRTPLPASETGVSPDAPQGPSASARRGRVLQSCSSGQKAIFRAIIKQIR
jgi:hypothetical protein